MTGYPVASRRAPSARRGDGGWMSETYDPAQDPDADPDQLNPRDTP
ncbi:MAG TPA: hypothetical protein PKB06_13345 [Actinotalea sp.]|nr:hypothetical protein [Actinotalea sp.]